MIAPSEKVYAVTEENILAVLDAALFAIESIETPKGTKDQDCGGTALYLAAEKLRGASEYFRQYLVERAEWEARNFNFERDCGARR